MNTVTVKRDLLENCSSREYREALVFENVYTGICSQIRVLREQRGWSQAALGRRAKMAQERISILEDPNAETKPTLNTLLRVASACDIGLDVRFVPFSAVLDRSTKTDSSELEVPSFDEERGEILEQLEREEGESQSLVGPTAGLVGLTAGFYNADHFQPMDDAIETIRRYAELNIRGLAFVESATENITPVPVIVSGEEARFLKIVWRNTNGFLKWNVSDSSRRKSIDYTTTTEPRQERTA